MLPISETRRKLEWQAIISANPQEFTWDGSTYTGRLTETRGFGLDPIMGGMIAVQEAKLYATRDDFDEGIPSEGDIISCRGIGWRVARVQLVMGYGVEFDLQGPEKR